MSFESLGLSAELLRAVHENGFTTPTEAQTFVVSRALAGANVLAAAQTGSGKTVAYSLAVLQRLALQDAAKAAQCAPVEATATNGAAQAHDDAAASGADDAAAPAATAELAMTPVVVEATHGSLDGPRAATDRTPRVLILVPTRELCAQVTESVRGYGRYLPLRCVQIFGGVGMQPQVVALRAGVDVVVATPGRLLDHVQRGSVDLSRLQVLVLDEADRMLDMGFRDVIARVLARLPDTRQSLVMSATYGDEVASLAATIAPSFELLELAPTHHSLDRVRQVFYAIEPPHKADALALLFHRDGWQRALVYTRTKHGADRLAKKLYRAGIGSDSIHGNKGQGARARAIGRFKAGEIAALVATDVAARALDVTGLPIVVNFDLPHVSEDYLHRVARAGDETNIADVVSLVAEDELTLLAGVTRLLGEEFTPQPLEGFVPRILPPRERPAPGPVASPSPTEGLAEDELAEEDDDRQPFATREFGDSQEQGNGDPRGKRNRRRRRGRKGEFDGPRTPTDLLPSGGILDAFSDDADQEEVFADGVEDDTQPAWLSEQAARFDPVDEEDVDFRDDDEDNIGNRISDPPQDFRNRAPFAGARGKKGPPPRGPRPGNAPGPRPPGYAPQAGPPQARGDRPPGPRGNAGRQKLRRQQRGPRPDGVAPVAAPGEETTAPAQTGDADARRARGNRRNRQRYRDRPRPPQGAPGAEGGVIDGFAPPPAATGPGPGSSSGNNADRRGPSRNRNGPRPGNGNGGGYGGNKNGNRAGRAGRAVEITHGGSRRRFFPSDWSKNVARTPRERLDYTPAPLRASSWEGGAPSGDSLRRDSQRVVPKIIERKKGRRLLTLKRDDDAPPSE